MVFPSTAVEWLSKLVSFDTTSAKSNLEVVKYISEYYKSLNVKHVIYYNKDKTKASIFAEIKSQLSSTEANDKQGGLMLNGHLDCVPVTGQKWQTDPFVATQVEDRIYGRGTCDMKGFISVCLSMLPSLVRSPPTKPVYFAWTYDEEIGCIGGKQLAEIIKEKQIHIDGCVVGEPTSNKVVVAHKGICIWKVCIYGKACHSSFALTDKGCNAIEYASRLIIAIREIAENLKKEGDKDKYYDTEFSTMSANVIQGGNAINTVPEHCEVLYEFRNLPTMAQDDIQKKVNEYIDTKLLPALQAECKEGTITLECMARVPSFRDIDEGKEFVKLMRKLTNDYEIHKLGCTTEAGSYALINIPVVVCGPGSIKVAHQQDEYVPIDDLNNCEKILKQLISFTANTKCKL